MLTPVDCGKFCINHVISTATPEKVIQRNTVKEFMDELKLKSKKCSSNLQKVRKKKTNKKKQKETKQNKNQIIKSQVHPNISIITLDVSDWHIVRTM